MNLILDTVDYSHNQNRQLKFLIFSNYDFLSSNFMIFFVVFDELSWQKHLIILLIIIIIYSIGRMPICLLLLFSLILHEKEYKYLCSFQFIFISLYFIDKFQNYPKFIAKWFSLAETPKHLLRDELFFNNWKNLNRSYKRIIAGIYLGV